MPGHCCKNNSSKKTDLLTFATYVRESVLCGIEGSAKFLISLSSYLQTSVYLRACRKNVLASEGAWEMAVKGSALAAMRRGALPAFEAFVLMPAMYVLLHTYAGLGIAYCLAGCWMSMFLVCLAARLTRFIKGCPELGEPLYESGRPFPAMGDTCTFLGGYSTMSSDFPSVVVVPLSFLKAFTLSFLFIPLRAVTLVSSLVLFTAKLASLPYAVLSDIWETGKSAFCSDSNHGRRVVYDNSFGCLKSMAHLVCAMATDLLWVSSLGVSGALSLRAAANRHNAANAAETAEMTNTIELSSCPSSEMNVVGCPAESARHGSQHCVAS